MAWLLLGLAAVFSAYILLRECRPRLPLAKGVYGLTGAVLAVLLLAGLVYPVTATMNRTNGLDNPTTLDGFAILRNSRPGEYEAIKWLTEDITGRSVIMEVIGDSVSGLSRVSAYTGLPKVLGWPGHENQWRGSFEPQGTRLEDVETAFSATDSGVAQGILDKYQVEFAYVGPRRGAAVVSTTPG